MRWGSAPSRKCASYRNEATPDLVINEPSLTNARCVSDSGGLATRSSRNFGSIESGLRGELNFQNRWPPVMVTAIDCDAAHACGPHLGEGALLWRLAARLARDCADLTDREAASGWGRSRACVHDQPDGHGANTMRSGLALCLLIALCASADAATLLRRSKPHERHLRPDQPAAVTKRFAVPGWSDEQTRYWLWNSSRGAGLG